MTRSSSPAAKLDFALRMDLAVKALAEDANISQLSTDHDVSRKFTYAQMAKAQEALGQAFAPSQPAADVLFSLPVTATWRRGSKGAVFG